jgi:hypothetical protein
MARRTHSRLPSRRRANRDSRREIHVFVEGEVTELRYIDDVKQLVRNPLIRVSCEGGQGVPKTLVEKACARKKELLAQARAEKSEPNFEVWAVFDVDAHPHLGEAKTQARDNKVNVAVSNPCFELWLLYHFVDFNAVLGRHALQARLANYCTVYRNTGKRFSLASCGDTPEEQLAAIRTACERSQLGITRRSEEGAPEGNPSSGCHGLLRVLLPS